MAYIGISFTEEDLQDNGATGSFDPLPPGTYDVEILKADLTATNAGDGKYINLDMSVTSSEYFGRRIFDKLNIENKNQTTEQIARANLGKILRIMEIHPSTFLDSDQMIGGKFPVRVTIEPETEKYKAKNKVVEYKTTVGKVSPAPQQSPQRPAYQPQQAPSPQQNAAPSKSAPPWAKK